MKLASLLRHLATAALMAGCNVNVVGIKGDGIAKTESRPIQDFTALEVAGAYDVQWSSGAPSLAITSDQNILPHIHSEVAGGTLKIWSDGSLSPTQGLKVVVNSSALTRVDLSGAVSLTAQKVAAASFTIVAAGASTINADGNVTDLIVKFTGASRLRAPQLNAKTADVSLVGASSAEIAVQNTLKAVITGAGSLTYSGQPSVEQQVTGAGSIHHK